MALREGFEPNQSSLAGVESFLQTLKLVSRPFYTAVFGSIDKRRHSVHPGVTHFDTEEAITDCGYL